MLDRDFVEQVAAALGTEAGLVEKEWHVVRALSAISSMDHGGVRPVFSGGTSLSVGWGLIKRFSEDIDFKVGMPQAPNPSQARTQRRQYRDKILTALGNAGLRLIEPPLSRDLSTFFSARLTYPNLFDHVAGLRPYLQVEMTFDAPTLPSVERPIHSLIARAQKVEPEIVGFACVDPVEIAADKLSALAWRVCTVTATRREMTPPSYVICTTLRRSKPRLRRPPHLHRYSWKRRKRAPGVAAARHQQTSPSASRSCWTVYLETRCGLASTTDSCMTSRSPGRTKLFPLVSPLKQQDD
jgi:hypothetical protein